jgi:cardiolipin synthase
MWVITVNHPLVYALVGISYVLALICAAQAILRSRTPQGATAWIMSLFGLPLLAVPLFLVFGRSRFEGYNNRRRIVDKRVADKFQELRPLEEEFEMSEEMKLIHATIPSRTQPGFTRGNSIELLVNGNETFPRMLEEIEKAQKYILLQVYIYRADELGRKFAKALMAKARAGVKVTLMNDDIGMKIPGPLLDELHASGVQTGSFNNTRGRGRLQVNFRNHRKILIVDGKVAFIGGLNIGDEYLGKVKKWGNWRDTHVMIQGPAVLAAQLSFAKDWYFISQKDLDLDWKLNLAKTDAHVAVLHTGPADDKQTCLLSHVALVNFARKRLWLASPYVVPPETLVDALILASLRGVDVRLILPAHTDARTVRLASRVYQEKFLRHGIQVYDYYAGFLHQKVMLVDDCFAVVGSANLDCRSMFVNFEITAISSDPGFIGKVESMLESDFMNSQVMTLDHFKRQGMMEKIASRGANLLAPVL